MKKRILSAALALAMALTLLPVSVFASYDSPDPAADIVGDGTERVQYINYIDANHPARGWYVTHNYPADTTSTPQKPAKSVDLYLGAAGTATGVSVGGMYYKLANIDESPSKDVNGVITNNSIYSYSESGGTFTKTGLKGQVTVIGGTPSIDVVNASSIMLDVCGGTATLTQNNTGGSTTKLTSVTVTNSQYANTQAQPIVNIIGVAGTLTSVSMSNVTWGETVNLNSKPANNVGSQGHSVILNNVAGSASIALDGEGTDAQGNPTSVSQTVQITNSSFGSITTKGNGSTVTLNQVKGGTPTVSMTGVGGSFGFTGGGTIGGLTVTTGLAKEAASAPANVSIAAGCTVASINAAGVAGEFGTSANTVSISGTVTGAVNLKNASVTVSGGSGNVGGKTTLGTGTVTVTGNRATMGDVELGHDATFNLSSGTNCTIGALTVAATGTPATVTFTVPKEPTNTLKSIGATYTKPTIAGGTWQTAVPAVNLTGVIYQLNDKTAGTFTYYAADQLGEAVLKQGDNANKDLTVANSTGSQTVTFKNGAITWGVLKVAPGTQIPKLPTQMNTVATPYWSDGKQGSLSGMYPTPATGNVVLDAGGGGATTGEVTKLTGVTATVVGTGKDITAKMVGNVITLSGAVDAGQTKFTLTLETDAVKSDGGSPAKDVPVTIDNVGVTFNPTDKTLSFNNPGTDGYALSNGVVVTDGFKALKLSNGTKYTLNGSGLVVRSNNLWVKGVDTGKAYPDITDATKVYSLNDLEVIVSAPNYTANDTLKKIVIDAVNGSGAGVDWSNSPAVKRAINAALASITSDNVTQYIQAARQRAWQDNGKRDEALTASTVTGYDNPTVWLVPYLEVTVTDYKPTTSGVNDSTLTANLSLKWRVEVHPTNLYSGTVLVNDAANVAKNGIFIAKAGAPLVLDSDLRSTGENGGVVVKLKNYTARGWNMHQGNTYGYAADGTGFTMKHAVSGNLGTVVINKTTPLVTRYTDDTATTVVARYNSLQAAVDDTTDGQYILVDSAYGGSMNINMTGKAREIKVQANGKNLVVANASGGLVTENKDGTLYTIKLNRDNTVAVTAADVVVNTANFGSVTSDVSKANVGATVTLVAKPTAGYKLNSLTAVTDGNVSVPVTASGTVNVYTFVVPTGAKKVTVTPSFVVADNKASISVNPNSAGTASVYTGTTDGRVQQGGSAIITLQPKNGYRTMDVAFRADNGSVVYSSRQDKNTWNITVPSGATLVTVTPSFDVDNGTPFVDVKSTDWASPYISWMYQKNYTTGKDTQYTFKPTDNVTRQEVVAFLWKANGSPSMKNSSYKNPFTDVYTSDWAYDAILWAAANGLVDTSSRTFGKTVNASRAEVVTILYKYAGSPAASTKTGFIDVPTSAAYAKAVSWAEKEGITNGKDNRNTFKPNIAITRQEVSKMIYVAEN